MNEGKIAIGAAARARPLGATGPRTPFDKRFALSRSLKKIRGSPKNANQILVE